MGQRKVNRVGTSTLTISLPSAWTKKNGVSAGDELTLTEGEGELRISTNGIKNHPHDVEIDTRGFTLTQLRRHVAQAYRSGADAIRVIYADAPLFHSRTNRKSSIRSELESMTTELLGMEVEEITASRIVLKQFSEALEVEFEAALRKVFHRIIDQTSQAIESLKSGDPAQLRAVWFADRTVNKFCNFCLRLLNRRSVSFRIPTNELYSAITLLEIIGDQIYSVPNLALKYEVKAIDEEVITLLKELQEGLRLLYKYFFDLNEEHFVKILGLRDRYFAVEKKLCSAKGKGSTATLCAPIGVAYELIVTLQDQVLAANGK